MTYESEIYCQECGNKGAFDEDGEFLCYDCMESFAFEETQYYDDMVRYYDSERI